MRFRPAPISANWLLKLFCSSPEHESAIGDLLEQYQRGRGHFWYWRQVIALAFLGLYGKTVRRPLVPANRLPIRQGFALILIISVLSAVLLSDISILFMAGILGGVIMGILKFEFGNGRAEPAKSDAPEAARIHMEKPITGTVMHHPGISMHQIPVEGAVGLLFAFATAFIFGVGIPAVRQMLVVTLPLGILGSGILLHWHGRHPVRIEALDLHQQKQNQ